MKDFAKQIKNIIIFFREARQGIDLVNDEPQKEILHEINLFKNCQSDLEKCLDVSKEKIRLLRKFWLEIQREINDKKAAMEIDRSVSSLNQHSSQVQRQDEVALQNYRYEQRQLVMMEADMQMTPKY
jgi:hypothetical protein